MRESFRCTGPIGIHVQQLAYKKNPVIKDFFRTPVESLISGVDCKRDTFFRSPLSFRIDGSEVLFT